MPFKTENVYLEGAMPGGGTIRPHMSLSLLYQELHRKYSARTFGGHYIENITFHGERAGSVTNTASVFAKYRPWFQTCSRHFT
jgi:hypothetical protein